MTADPPMAPSEAKGTIDIDDLLTIDVESELRKLAEAQFQGPWQLPAELARRSLKVGASRVDVRLGRHRMEVQDDGVALARDLLESVAALLDRGTAAGTRHRALIELERSGNTVLLALAGCSAQRLVIETHSAGGGLVLSYQAGRRPEIREQAGQRGEIGTRVELRSNELDRQQATAWLTGVCRFSEGRVSLGGKTIAAGFSDAVAEASLRSPLRGRVAVLPGSDAAHIWLLEHGVVTAHLGLPDAPCFEAAVELGHLGMELNAAALRDAFQPFVAPMCEQAVGLMLAAARHPAALPTHVRTRLTRLLLQAAKRRIRLREIAALPLFRATTRDAGEPVWLSLVDLRQAAELDGAGGLTLAALYPSQDPRRFALGETPVLVLDEAERSLLSELLSLRFQQPESRSTGSFMAALARSFHGVGRALQDVAATLHGLGHRPLADTELSTHEISLLVALREQAANAGRERPDAIHMCAGAGPIRRSPRRVILPRHNTVVAASVTAFAGNQAWLYPAYYALLDSAPSAGPRARWLAFEPPTPS